jgi:glycosyltransferase involved in cell wall biosynthesis
MDEPIRILELRSVRGTGGGPDKTILTGTAQADPTRYAITVCYIRDKRDRSFRISGRARQLPIDYAEIQERHPLDPAIWRRARALVRERRVDIVHAHDYKTDLLAFLLGLCETVVPISTAHGWAGHTPKEELLYYPLDRWLLTRFPRVIAVSADIKDRLVSRGAKPECVTVVPNGIDVSVFRREQSREKEARSTLRLDEKDQVIGAVGRLEKEKNYPLLIRSFANLAGEFPGLKVLIAGDGTLREELSQLIGERGLSERCLLLGQVEDIVFLHHALNLFVMCSDNEGSPNAVLEAMALGTPVVSTDVGGIRDLLEHRTHALLVPRGDEASLTAAIRDALTDVGPTRDRAVAARLKVERDLSFERRMRRVEEVYDDTFAKYRNSPWRVHWWKAHDA